MKTLIVFYSRSGVTRKVAEHLSSLLKCDTEELISKKSRKGLFGWLMCGKEGMKKVLAEIENTKKDAGDYDLIIIGTPTWAGNMSSPIRTYLTNNKGKFKQVAFFCTKGGQGNIKSFAEMESVCGKKPAAILELTARDVKKGAFIPCAEEFSNSISVSNKAKPKKSK